ncbi:TPA: AAA family ATPase [Streptococcus suis]|nr:AAA family ATPase [Streptococcus suis]
MIIKHKITLREQVGRVRLAFWSHFSTSSKFKYLLQTNRLFLVEDIKDRVIKNGEKVSKSKIETSVSVRWWKERNEFDDVILVAQFIKTGSALIDDRLGDLTGPLQALFRSKVWSRQNELTHVEYRLLYKQSKGEEVYYLYDPVEEAKMGKIRLNRYIEWQPHKVAHLLLSAKTGGGKTFLLNKIVREAMRETSPENIYICDGKQSDLKRYARAMNLPNNANSIDEIADFVHSVNLRMQELYSQDKKAEEPIFLVIDEYLAISVFFEKDKKKAKEVTNELLNILVLGRAANVQVILASQSIRQESFGSSNMRSQFGVKILLGNATADEFKMAFDTPRKDNEMLKRAAGEGYISIDNGDVILFERSVISDER